MPHFGASTFGIHFNNRAVGQNVDLFALDFDLIDRRLHLVAVFADFEIGIRLESLSFQKRDGFRLRRDRPLAHIIDIVKQNFGIACRSYFGVEIADSARDGVPRVFQRFFGMRFIVLFQNGKPYHRFAAHFQNSFVSDFKRKTFDRKRLRGHVLSLYAVSARRRADKGAVLVNPSNLYSTVYSACSSAF